MDQRNLAKSAKKHRSPWCWRPGFVRASVFLWIQLELGWVGLGRVGLDWINLLDWIGLGSRVFDGFCELFVSFS